MNKSLVGLNKKELNSLLTSMGVSEKQLNMRTNQLWNWIYVRGAKSISEMTNLSKEFRKELNEQFNLTRPEISKNEISFDRLKFNLLEDIEKKLLVKTKCESFSNSIFMEKKHLDIVINKCLSQSKNFSLDMPGTIIIKANKDKIIIKNLVSE